MIKVKDNGMEIEFDSIKDLIEYKHAQIGVTKIIEAKEDLIKAIDTIKHEEEVLPEAPKQFISKTSKHKRHIDWEGILNDLEQYLKHHEKAAFYKLGKRYKLREGGQLSRLHEIIKKDKRFVAFKIGKKIYFSLYKPTVSEATNQMPSVHRLKNRDILEKAYQLMIEDTNISMAQAFIKVGYNPNSSKNIYAQFYRLLKEKGTNKKKFKLRGIQQNIDRMKAWAEERKENVLIQEKSIIKTFPELQGIDSNNQSLLIQLLKGMIKDPDNVTIRKEVEAEHLSIRDVWMDFLLGFLVKAIEISEFLGVENKFKVENNYSTLKYDL